jgi:hypothetical protein
MKFVSRWLALAALTVAALAPGAARAQVTATVNWGSLTGKAATGNHYGLNLYQGFDPNVTTNSTYKTNLAAMKPGIVRYHRWDMIKDASAHPSGWATGTAAGQTTGWDSARINTAMNGLNTWGATVMMNIPGWPDKWKTAGTGKLDPAYYADFANWCAELVRIVNVTQGRGVKYWEVPNEQDGSTTYDSFDESAELGRLYNQCAAAMKAVDPTIKVGGPAFTQPWNQPLVDGFLSTAAPNVDFISYHTYSTGSTTSANQGLFNSASGLGGGTNFLRGRIAAYTSRTVEIFHDEFNISYAPPDGRMNNEIGMVFDALAVISLANAGATGAMAWNECDGWYGKLSGPTTCGRRPSSFLYEIFNTDMKGDIVTTTSSDAAKVVLMGVKGGTWIKLALVNRAESDQTVTFSSFDGLPAGAGPGTSFTVKRVQSWGLSYSNVTLGTLQSGYTLPANTVTVLVLNTATITPPTLTVSFSAASGGVNLTAEGTQDWGHWGLSTAVSLSNAGKDRKNIANGQISDVVILGADNLQRVTDFATTASWSDGTPTASATDTPSAVQMYKWWTLNTGFRLTVPASTTQRTLKLYCGTGNATGQLKATLSDNSAPAVTVTHTGQSYRSKDGVYTIVFRAGGANQTLTVEFTATANLGSYSPSATRLSAATLQ